MNERNISARLQSSEGTTGVRGVLTQVLPMIDAPRGFDCRVIVEVDRPGRLYVSIAGPGLAERDTSGETCEATADAVLGVLAMHEVAPYAETRAVVAEWIDRCAVPTCTDPRD